MSVAEEVVSEVREELAKERIWSKALEVPGVDPAVMRKDRHGYLMRYVDYGNRRSAMGWEIDPLIPIALGGPQEEWNLEPLNWMMNKR